MIIRYFGLLGFILLLMGCGGKPGSAPVPPNPEVLEKAVNELVEPFIADQWTMGMVVAIVKPEGDSFFSYGRRNAESEESPDEKDVFEIGSITKVFQALALVEVAQEEGLSLTVLAKTFVRELSHVSREGQDPITLEDLASHQSGLPLVAGNFWQEGDNRYSHDLSGQRWLGYDEAMLTDWLTSTDFRRPESPSYLYSNLGAGVLSVCLAKHDGKSIAEVIEARICEPLGLQDTGFQVEQTVHGYTATLEQTDHWVSADAVFAGTYGLRSTARDMAVFAREVMAMENGKLGRVVVESAKVRGKINDLENTCQGWKRNVFDVLYTTGSTGGFKSAMFLHLPSRT